MIWYFTPYATDKNYYAAIDKYCKLVPEEDWICIMDGDTMFLLSHFGHILDGYIQAFPETGLFTCYTNRCHYGCQRLEHRNAHLENILAHRAIAAEVFEFNKYTVKELNRHIAGHLMLFKKSTWNLIKPEVNLKVKSQNKKILGVDTKISNAMLNHDLPIRLMKGVYIFHYMRLHKNMNDNTHLL